MNTKKIHVKFAQINKPIKVNFAELNKPIQANFGVVHHITDMADTQLYEGSYEVTPKVTSQTLPTKEKFLTEDVTVKAIPYFDVSNSSGGTTVYIAKEI